MFAGALEILGKYSTNLTLVVPIVAAAILFLSALGADQIKEREKNAFQIALAEANKAAREAELKTEQLRKELGPRTINLDSFVESLRDKPGLSVEIYYLRDDPDSSRLASSLWLALLKAKWHGDRPTAIPPKDPSISGDYESPWPLPLTVGGQPGGVTLVEHQPKSMMIVSPEFREYMKGPNREGTPFAALFNALQGSLGLVWYSRHPSVPENKLRVVIAPRS